MDLANLDFSLFEELPPPCRHYEVPRLSVSPEGELRMNMALLRAVGERREFRIALYPDGLCLALYAGSDGGARFSAKNGVLKYRELADALEKKGVYLPAVYTMQWCAERGAWVGFCQELAGPPPVALLPRPEKRGRNRKRGLCAS